MIHSTPQSYHDPDVTIRILTLLAAVLGAATLASCGKTGDLYLPDEDRVSRRQ